MQSRSSATRSTCGTARYASPSPPPDPDAARGVELLRAGRWFEAHEAFEDAWRRAEASERDFLQGLVHVAVAWYQATRRNRTGTERQLEKAQRRLAPYAPSHGGLDVAGLLHSVDAARGRFPELPAPAVAPALPHGPAFDRAVAFMAGIQERSAVTITPFAYGRVFSDPGRPALWDLNFTRLEVPADRLTAEELSRAAEGAHARAGHRHRKLYVADERAAVALAPGLRQLGWKLERYLVMALVRKPDPGRNAVEEVTDEELRPSRRAYVRTWDEELGPEGVEQLAGFAEARRRAIDVRLFAHRERRVPVSWCELYSADRVGQVEDVATLPAYRGRGYATSVVAHATRESVAAGNDLTFLVVDETNGPVGFYERLGYEPLGRDHAFFRAPPERSSGEGR